MTITAEMHDGTRLEFPDGTDPAVIQRTVRSVLEKNKPASVAAGDELRQIPRQLGLTARYAMEALGGVGDIVHEPIRAGVNWVADKINGGPNITELVTGPRKPAAPKSLTQMASDASDYIGLPSPKTADERVIGDATRTGFSAMTMAGGSRAAANRLTGGARDAFNTLAQKPLAQTASGAGAGAAGGSVREAGGSPGEQFAASVVGGLVAPGAVSLTANGGRTLVNKLTPQAVKMEQADNAIRLTMQRQGIDWDAVESNVKNTMRQQVVQAMDTGRPLDAAAMRRLLTFQSVPGTRPTVGMLTQNPGQITRERNLAKVSANSTDMGLQRLPELENQNVNALLSNLDEAGAANAPTKFAAGSRVINALDSRVTQERGNINSLYERARGTDGRSLPLEGGTFTRRANELIDEAMAGDSLPKAVEKRLNAIAAGEYPLTVASAEAFKTRIGKLQRGTNDGNTRHALGLVRQALDETPLQGSQAVNPKNLPAIQGDVPPSVAAGDESIQAFNAARKANRDFMARIESNPALKAVVDGVEPDRFFDKFVLNGGATAKDLAALRGELGPDGVNAIKQTLVKHLRDAATNGTDDITKFSNQGYRDALRNLGDEKLAVFFSKEELSKLKNIGEAAKYMQAQPAGSAVNNSNSGALIAGKFVDMLDKFGGKVPFGDVLIQGNIRGLQQSQALKPANALAAPRASQPFRLPPNMLLLPSTYLAND